MAQIWIDGTFYSSFAATRRTMGERANARIWEPGRPAMLQASMRKHHDGEAGFTLVELLMSITIVGVIAPTMVGAIVLGLKDRKSVV